MKRPTAGFLPEFVEFLHLKTPYTLYNLSLHFERSKPKLLVVTCVNAKAEGEKEERRGRKGERGESRLPRILGF